jgi:hypothetical protein
MAILLQQSTDSALDTLPLGKKNLIFITLKTPQLFLAQC